MFTVVPRCSQCVRQTRASGVQSVRITAQICTRSVQGQCPEMLCDAMQPGIFNGPSKRSTKTVPQLVDFVDCACGTMKLRGFSHEAGAVETCFNPGLLRRVSRFYSQSKRKRQKRVNV